MSHIVAVAMEMLWSSYILMALFSVDAAHSHKGSQGLSCLNDFVNNVSCIWNGPPLAPGANCSISGVKPAWTSDGLRIQIIRSCKVEQHGHSPPGCSFVFENKEFNSYKSLPYIRMECDGTLVENITNYVPQEHIKMHPPGVPNVNFTGNDTLISWNASSPCSIYITAPLYQVAIKHKKQSWKEVKPRSADKSELRLPSEKYKGHCKVRVRVKSSRFSNSHWSNWSPVTSWQGPPDVLATSEDQGDIADKMSFVRWGVMLALIFSFVLVLVVTLVLSKRSKRLHQVKPVPNPSKYFHTLHSVYEGNLKKWLNPLSAPESFFTAQPCDLISPVELCDSSDVAPSISPSSSSTSALLHLKSYSSAGWDTSGVADNSSSSSSSCFSNMGYFMSSTSCSSVQTDPNPAYFTYQDEFHNLHKSHNPHLSLCPPTTISPPYESLSREPLSPDSGFGIEKEDEDGKEDKIVVIVEGAEVSYDHLTTPLLILPLHLPSRMCPPSSPPPSPIAPNLPQVCSDSQQVDTPVEAAGGSYAAWPLANAMCRSSSMPVETCKTGYLTLKELQTTFSNKSI